MNALQVAIEAVGSQAELASAIGVKQPTVSEWLRMERPIPEARCAAIERATKGAVQCEQLREDLSWQRKRDPTWPWHPKGRPLLDVLPAAA